MNATAPQSAAAPSPFPPIADYAFLSNCHTGALVALDGAIDWLCVPAFDSPSVFGTLLDREAGYFRFGPFGINHPTARAYEEAGTNVLVTTWKTPSGWAEVRDALTMGPRTGDDEVTPHTRPPADDDCDHMLVRTVRCLEGHIEMELVQAASLRSTTAGSRPNGRWWAAVGRRPTRPEPGRPCGCRPTWPWESRATGLGPGASSRQATRRYCSLSWAANLASVTDVEDANRRLDTTTRYWRNWLGTARIPDHRWREPIQALRPGRQGPHLHADRRHGRGAHHVAARDPRRRAQLGLPLHLDPGLDVHLASPAFHELGLGGRRVHAVHRRPRAQQGRRATDHVRHRRPPRPHRVDP